MTCNNCHSPDCKVAEAQRREIAELESDSNAIAWLKAEQDLIDAQSDCAHRAAHPVTDWNARIGAIEARQDRIEAMLIAKGYEL